MRTPPVLGQSTERISAFWEATLSPSLTARPWHAEFQADVVDMARPGAAAGVMRMILCCSFGLEQFVEDRQQGLGSPVHDGLAADFEHVDVGVHCGRLRAGPGGQKRPADQGFAHERRVDVQTAAAFGLVHG